MAYWLDQNEQNDTPAFYVYSTTTEIPQHNITNISRSIFIETIVLTSIFWARYRCSLNNSVAMGIINDSRTLNGNRDT